VARRPTPTVEGPLPDDAQLVEATRRALSWGRSVAQRAVRDVFLWRVGDTWKLALYGPPKPLGDALGFSGKMENRNRFIDRALAAAYGVAFEVRRSASGAAEPWPDYTHAPRAVGPSDILNGLRFAALEFAGMPSDAGMDVTVLPEPGWPWAGRGTMYYSARAGRWVEAEEPPWKVVVEVRDTGRGARVGATRSRAGADWCRFAPRVEAPDVAGRGWARKGDLAVMVTHALELHDGWAWGEASKAVARCGGLLFPSLAVGPVPATHFGPAVFVADTSLVLSQLRPYRRGRRSDLVTLYSTDAHTHTTADAVGEESAALYDELTGNTDEETWMYGRPHLRALGPRLPDEEDGGPVGRAEVATVSAMLRVLRARFKIWRGPMDAARFERAQAAADHGLDPLGMEAHADEYAYLEAKARGVVPMSSFVALYVPDFYASSYEDFARVAGYAGPVHVLETSGEERDAYATNVRRMTSEEAVRVRYNYAWRVAGRVKADLRSVDLLA